MPHLLASESDFFTRMEEFGFFDGAEKKLPDEFSLVYEIARVLEDGNHFLTEQLAPVLWLLPDENAQKQSTEKEIIPHLPAAEEYEAYLIDSYRDIARIYPHQFLLPDEVFYQRLAERSLWMPKPKAPNNYRYSSESSNFAPDSRKQKVYILFDSSRSMQEHYRSHLAKAIAYFFLRRNARELGVVFFRTFDHEIGTLHIANDVGGYRELIGNMMRLHALGRGTALEKALETAINDIHAFAYMTEAEILVITDGAAHINTEKIRGMLGDTIRINTVKIGDASISPSPNFMRDYISNGNNEETKTLRAMQERVRDIERQLHSLKTESRRSALQSELKYNATYLAQETEKLSKKISETYGREIESLSDIFITIEDIEPEKLFSIQGERLEELKELTAELLEVMRNEPTIEYAKRAAALEEHLDVLLEHRAVEDEELSAQAKELKELLEKILKQAVDGSAVSMNISDEDRLGIVKLLGKSASGGLKRLQFMRFLRLIVRRIKRAYILWKQRRKRRRTLRSDTK